jgi:transcriptional regulator with XRE-family HTH domain
MPVDKTVVDPQSFTTFGPMLRFLRRRARLTQRDLGIAAGYSEGHINRFEKSKHLPDPSTVAALFVPALDLGDAPELASRLIELSALGSTSSAESTSGASAQIEVADVLEPIPVPAPHTITRTHILANIHEQLARTRHVALCGLPGIGKTTLASLVASDIERIKSMPVFWLTLTEGMTSSVDAILRQIALFLILHGHDPVKPIVATDPRIRAKLALDHQIRLIGSAFAKQPALLCFDNAQEIGRDEECLRVLDHLAAATPVWLLLTTRESLPLSNVAEIPIPGFENAEALTFLAQSSLLPLDEKQAERLIEKTAGSPILLRLAVGQFTDPHCDIEALVAHLESQPQVADYLLRTIQKQMSVKASMLLALLAVFRQPLNLYDPYLSELALSRGNSDNYNDAIVELQRRHLIDDAAHALLHPLVRDYVYLTLSTQVTKRQRLHRFAADWLTDTNKDKLAAAMHYTCAGLPDQALDLIEENARAIMGNGQALAAVEILNQVHSQIQHSRLGQNELRRRLLTLRGILLMGTLRIAEGEADLRQAIELTSNPAVRANIICQLADLTNQRSNFQETLRLVQKGRADLVPDDRLLRARLASLEGTAHSLLGNLDETVRAANAALALADQMADLPESLVGEIRAEAQFDLANVARLRRDLPEAMKCALAALEAERTAHQPRIKNRNLGFIGGLYCDFGNLAASFRYRHESLDGFLAAGDVHSAAYQLITLADIHHQRLEQDQALEKLSRAVETLRIVEDMRGLAAAESLRTSCLLWQNQVREAREVIDRLLAEAEGKGTEGMWGYRLNKLAIVQLVQMQARAAIVTLQHALTLQAASARRMMRFELNSTLSLAQAAAGDHAAAVATLANAPIQEGLSCWALFDRALIEAYVKLACGDAHAARTLAEEITQRTKRYALYQQCSRQLLGAIEASAPANQFPRMLWVGG